MRPLNLVAAQAGGPTAVLNTSLAALLTALRQQGDRGAVWGSRYGMHGLAYGDWCDLAALSEAQLLRLAMQPGAALGSSRYRPTDRDMEAIVERLRTRAVDALVLMGGNGTMAAAARITEMAAANHAALQVIGVPKTIDNDLAGVDVTPGFGSAARYIAFTTWEIGLDLQAMRGFEQVAILEVMGRHAGWLAAASALARYRGGDMPHLILLPETPINVAHVLSAIDEAYRTHGVCLVVTSEGVRDREGRYLAELHGAAASDASGQRIFSLASGAAAYLSEQVTVTLGLRCRPIRPCTMQRASAALASALDRRLAALAAEAAVAGLARGERGVMMGLRRSGGEWVAVPTPLAVAQQGERLMPAAFIDADAYDVTPAFVEYARPFVEPMPPESLVFS